MHLLILRKFFLFILCTSLLASCVTKKKYDDLAARKAKIDLDLAACEKAMARVQNERKTLEAEMARQLDANQLLVKDSTNTGTALRKTQKMYH